MSYPKEENALFIVNGRLRYRPWGGFGPASMDLITDGPGSPPPPMRSMSRDDRMLLFERLVGILRGTAIHGEFRQWCARYDSVPEDSRAEEDARSFYAAICKIMMCVVGSLDADKPFIEKYKRGIRAIFERRRKDAAEASGGAALERKGPCDIAGAKRPRPESE